MKVCTVGVKSESGVPIETGEGTKWRGRSVD